MVRKLESSSKSSAVLKNPCLKSTMEKLFEKRSTTGDIKFMVDGEVIHAHRCVLAALSPRYEAQFYGALAEKGTINVEDVSSAAFKEFLQFFYTDEVTLTLDNIEDVLNLAKQSLVDELVSECTNFILNVIGMDKLLWCYRLTIDNDLKPLEEFCVRHIGMDIEGVFQTTEFLNCERDMLCHILNLDAMDCKETDVFAAYVSWAGGKCQRDGLDAADTANLRMALGEAMFKIRFCSMEAEEFAVISRNYSGLLSAQESIEVFQAITLKANGVHSTTFGEKNSKKRIPVLSSGECSFTNGSRIPFKSEHDFNTLIFETNKAISLNCFIICNKINDDIEVVINRSRRGKLNLKNTKITSETETKILFENPVYIEADEIIAIGIFSKAFKQSNSSLCGFNLESRTTQNGVSFGFFTHAKVNLITRLLFSFCDTVRILVSSYPIIQ